MSIFAFAYVVWYLSCARGFQASSHNSPSLSLALTCVFTHLQSSDMQLMNTPGAIVRSQLVVSVPVMAGKEGGSRVANLAKAACTFRKRQLFGVFFSLEFLLLLIR